MSAPLDPLVVQFNLIHDCIRACIYADYIGQKKDKEDAWQSIEDMCYSHAVISWNQIFGSNSQNAHWKTFVERLPVQDRSNLKPFSKQIIIEHLKILPDEWEKYHRAMVKARNKWLVHFDHKLRPALPKLIWAQNSCYLYRDWLLV